MFLKCQNFYTLGVEEYFTKTGDFTWGVPDCEELVGVDQGAKYETLWQALMHKCIKNYKGTPKGGLPQGNDQPKIYSARNVRSFEDFPVTLL